MLRHPLLRDPVERALIGLTAVAVTVLALDVRSDRLRVAVGWSTALVLIVSATLLAGALSRRRRGDADGRFWAGLAGGYGLISVGIAVQLVTALQDPAGRYAVVFSPVAAICQTVAMYLVLAVLLTYPLPPSSRRARTVLYLDSGTVLVAAVTFGVYFGAAAVAGPDPAQVALRVVTGPVADLLVVFSVSKLLLTGKAPYSPTSGVLGGLGAGCGAVAVGLAPSLSGPGQQHWALVVCVLATAFVALAARAEQIGAEVGIALLRRGRRFSALPYLAVFGAYGLLVAALLPYDLSRTAWSVVGGASACTALVVLRQLTALAENDRLLAERDALTAQLHHQAFHDPLTGLANRALLTDRIEAARSITRRTGRLTVLMLVDLDDFKPINDRRGHDAGDAVLVGTADRMTRVVRETDTVARLGGDEFAVLLHDPAPDGLEPYARRLLAAVTEPLPLPDGPATVGASIGIAVDRTGDRTAAELLKAADAAMYAAKAHGKGAVAFEAQQVPAPVPAPGAPRGAVQQSV